MTSESLKTLVAGNGDAANNQLALRWGHYALACTWEGLNPSDDANAYSTQDFTRGNPFAALALYHKAPWIKRVTKQMTVNNRTVTRTLFKGES